MYKLVAVDMDGTLLNNQGKISNENLSAIKKCLDKGVKVVFTTGRGIHAISRFIEEVGLSEKDEYVITNNGVTLYSTNTKKCLKSSVLSHQDIKDICNNGLEYGAKLHIYDSEGCICIEENEFTRFERDHIGMPVKVMPDFMENINESKDIFKILYVGEPKLIDNIQLNINNKFRDKYSFVRSLPMVIEVFDKGCNKGIAVKELSNMFDIRREEVIAIGDQQNDLEMIEFAGVGVAMGNAVSEVKEIADYITDTNENNGVAKVLEKYIL